VKGHSAETHQLRYDFHLVSFPSLPSNFSRGNELIRDSVFCGDATYTAGVISFSRLV